MFKLIAAFSVCFALALAGCAVLEPVQPKEILKHPFGTPHALQRGMSKEQVRDMFGEPDVITHSEEGTDLTSTAGEKWVYHGRYSKLPVDAGYLSKTKTLTFDGDSLVGWED